MKNFIKILVLSFLLALVFGKARPAKAFYLEVPPSVKNFFSALSAQKSIAQETHTMDQTMQMPMSEPMPVQQYGQPTQTCNIDGVERPGSCDQYKQYNQGPMQGGQGQYMGPNPEDQKRDEQRQLQDMKRNVRQMERPVKEFERMIANAEKKGATISDEVRQNLAKAKALLETIKNATTMEEMQNVDMAEMGDIMQSMEDFRRDVVEKQQRLDGMRRGIRGMEQGLKMFENQVARLAKSKIVVPADVTENIAKLKTIITQVKTAKTTEEIDAIDFEAMQDLMQDMDESRQKLEHLSRWPQTLKDINRQLTQLQREQKRAKSIADRLVKKGMDVQDLYNSFVEAINKLKSVRDSAVEKMSAGNGDEAFDLIENEFFGQTEDVWQHFRVLMMMSNMGQFTAEFKREIAQAQQTINRLKRQKIDTSELEDILQQAKDKGQEIQNMIKTKDFDEETIKDAFDEMENIGQEFDSKAAELGGQEQVMPWEKGPQQFKRVEMSPEVQKFMPVKQESVPQSMPAEPTEAPLVQ